MKYHRAMPSCSLIISTYNTPDRLRRCLQSVLRQRVVPMEIIIADDGSGADTKKVITDIAAVSPVPVIHVWQPDDGFRLARIRNKALCKASGEYIINIDGDILLDKHFVHDHLYFARRGRFIAGERAFLSTVATQKYMNEASGFPLFYTRDLQKRQHAFRNLWIAKLYGTVHRSQIPYMYVTGCNMSFWKEDILKINGYNEAFKGWGGEDFDIAVRLFNAGIKQYFLHFYAVAYHMYHPENNRGNAADNEKLFRQSVADKITRIEHGIDKHIEE